MDPSIAETTEKAIRILRRNPRGFFLLVEGEEGGWSINLSIKLGIKVPVKPTQPSIHLVPRV